MKNGRANSEAPKGGSDGSDGIWVVGGSDGPFLLILFHTTVAAESRLILEVQPSALVTCSADPFCKFLQLYLWTSCNLNRMSGEPEILTHPFSSSSIYEDPKVIVIPAGVGPPAFPPCFL